MFQLFWLVLFMGPKSSPPIHRPPKTTAQIRSALHEALLELSAGVSTALHVV